MLWCKEATDRVLLLLQREFQITLRGASYHLCNLFRTLHVVVDHMGIHISGIDDFSCKIQGAFTEDLSLFHILRLRFPSFYPHSPIFGDSTSILQLTISVALDNIYRSLRNRKNILSGGMRLALSAHWESAASVGILLRCGRYLLKPRAPLHGILIALTNAIL